MPDPHQVEIALAFTLLTGLGLAAGLDPMLSRADLALWLVMATVGLLGTRIALGALTRHWAVRGRLDRRTAIYGAGPACANLIRALEADIGSDVKIVGICDDRGGERVGSDVLGYPRIGGLDELIMHARQSRIDTVLVTLPIAAEQRLLQILDRLSVLPAEVRQPASATELRLSARAYSTIGSQPMLALVDKPIADWGLVAKSAFDKLVAGLSLIMLSPVLAAVALAIKLDSRGPILFRQKRYGFNNELIDVLKFRSMYVEQADSRAERLVTRSDPRVTRVGRFIRKTSLDELPQLFNVLTGRLCFALM